MIEEGRSEHYAWGRLSDRRRDLFERRFLSSPARRERLNSALALKDYAQQKSQPRQHEAEKPSLKPSFTQRLIVFFGLDFPFMEAAISAILLMAMAAGVWSIIRLIRLESQLAAFRSEQTALIERSRDLEERLASQSSASDELRAELKRESDQRKSLEQDLLRLQESQSVTAQFDLGPAFSSGGAAVTLPRNASLVRLTLDLGLTEYETFRVTITDEAGKQIWDQGSLAARSEALGKTLVLRTSARLFSRSLHLPA